MSQTVEPPLADDAAPGVADLPRLPRPILIRAQEGDAAARPPLFYFGGAIAGPDAFAAVVSHLRPGPAVYACCFPGSGGPADGNWAHRSVPSLAAEFVEDIRRIQPSGPYLLCGYSLGARIVFEAARQIRLSGEMVGLLALLDGWGPDFPLRYAAPRRVLIHVRNLLRGRGAIDYMKGRFVNVKDRLTRRAARRTAAANGDNSTSSLSAATPAGFALIAPRRHRPNVYEGDVVLIRADVTPDWPGSSFEDPTNGWTPFVRGAIDVRRVRCRHLELLSPPVAAELARVLDDCMAKAP